jgi:hypothetical protein
LLEALDKERRKFDDEPKPEETAESELPQHKPPSRNVGDRDERDIIASSLQQGASPKELVDSIRDELKSMSGRLLSATEASRKSASNMETANGGVPVTETGGDTGAGDSAVNPNVRKTNGDAKPMKKPRRAAISSS